MEKVKVWGLEIDSCWKCYHHGRTDFDELCCSYTGTVIKSDINEDCPFSKPITKEVIEGFGFEFQDEVHDVKRYFLYGKADVYQLTCSETHFRILIKGITNEKNMYIFRGKINNPVELEFILKSIGVIE